MLPKITTKLLRDMKLGEEKIVINKDKQITSLATKLKMKVNLKLNPNS